MPEEGVPTTALERAIHSQPDELARLLDAPIPHETLERLKQAHRIWLVGTGSSQHAAELGSMMLHDAGRAAYPVSSMRFVNWAPPVDAQDAVLVISHNAGAETSYAASAYSMSIAAGLRVVTVTRRGGGLIGAFETVEKEASQTYTVSYTAALVALARLAGELGAETCAPEVLARVPGALRAAIDDPGTQAIARPDRLLLFAGEGPAGITAREGALKAREAARSLAEGYDVEYLLHGSAVPITPADHLIALVPPDTHGLVAGVAHAAGAEGVRVTTVSEPADLPPVLAQIPMTARLQMLALRFALERGTDPDIVIEGAWAADDLWSMGAPGG